MRRPGLALLTLGWLTALPAAPVAALDGPEPSLLAALQDIREGHSHRGMEQMADLTRNTPNFRLAQLFYGDLLAARSGRPGPMPDSANPAVRDLLDEAGLRVRGAGFVPPAGSVPGNVLALADSYRYLVIADLPKARLNLFENLGGELRLIDSYYAGIGRNGYGKRSEGDLRTPVGIYHVTGWRSDGELPELYGAGALPLDYPNLWDRFRFKTGSGIWLHGVPRTTYVRAPRSSEGCVTLANADLLALKPYLLKERAPVVMTDHLDWVPRAERAQQRDLHLQRIEDWRQKWSAKDTAGYLDYYGEDFTTAGMNKRAFVEHKQRVNAGKRYIKVMIGDISLYRYPGEPMMLAEFTMDYRSDNFSSLARKQQYWRQTAKGDWKIFREENLD